MCSSDLFEAGANAEQTVMIGDTAYDMEMAKAAWVRGVGVDWGYHHPEELMKAGAEFVAETPDQLRAHLLA